MAAKKRISKTREQINKLYEENELAALKGAQSRANSFTVGTTTGGIIELGMRGNTASLWYLLQPVEAIEIIGQLAAATGVEIAMRPRNDFASWRSWDTSLPDDITWLGSAPWQLSEDRRTAIAAVKEKNIKSIKSEDEKSEESEDDRPE